MSAILPGLVDRATTATKGSPTRRAKYASLIAVDPLDASTTVLLAADVAVADGVEEQRPGEPVLEAARGVGRLVLDVDVDGRVRRHGQPEQVGVGAAAGVGVQAGDGPVDPLPVRRRGLHGPQRFDGHGVLLSAGSPNVAGRRGPVRPFHPGRCRPCRAVAVRVSSSRSTSAAMSASERSSPSPIHCANATPNTVMPDSAARVAAGSSTPRARSAVGDRRGEAGELVQLAFLQRGVLVDHRLPGPGVGPALVREEATPRTAGRRRRSRSGTRPGGAASHAARNAWTSWSCPKNSTSRLSLKWRKNVRSVRPTDWAISAAVVCSNPRVANSSSAASCSRSGAPGSHRDHAAESSDDSG